MLVLNGSMFTIALPSIRDYFQLEADAASWLVIIHSLVFMMLMPLYGKLGDAFGRRILFCAAIVVFAAGTVVSFLSPGALLLIAGRIIQGIGVASVHPTSISIITDRFPNHQRGKAMGTWNTIGPATGLAAPLLAGFITDNWGWRLTYVPTLVAALVAVFFIWWKIPKDSKKVDRSRALREFDWLGVFMLCTFIFGLVVYVSSRPVTGKNAFTDWRILLGTLVLGFGVLLWEKRRRLPFITYKLFSDRNFTISSICVAVRMFPMSAVSLLIPLYLADVRHLSATSTGTAMMVHAGALLVTMRIGGYLSDRLNIKIPILIGLVGQGLSMVLFALLPETASIAHIISGLVLHGLGAGLSLAAFHKIAMGRVPIENSGEAAGLYSMIRFAGVLFGSALGGVVLQLGLERGGPLVQAYQRAFVVFAAITVFGAALSFRLRDRVGSDDGIR